MQNENVISIEKEILNELENRIEESVKKHLKKVDLSEDDENKIEKKRNLVEFVKVLSGSSGSGSFLVPTEFEASVIEKLTSISELRRLSTVLPMSSDLKKLNALVTYPTVSIVGEAAQIPETEPGLADVTLKTKKYAAIIGGTNELFDDNELDSGNITTLMDVLISSFVTALAEKEENEFVNGTSSGSEGILQAPGTTTLSLPTGKTNFSDIEWQNLVQMLTQLQAYSVAEAKNAAFLMHPTVFAALAGKAQVNEMSYYRIVNLRDREDFAVADVMGVPIILSNAMPSTAESTQTNKKFVALAFWKRHAFIGDRLGVKVDVSMDGSFISGSSTISAFQNDMKLIRLVKRTAFATALQSGIVTLKTAAS